MKLHANRMISRTSAVGGVERVTSEVREELANQLAHAIVMRCSAVYVNGNRVDISGKDIPALCATPQVSHITISCDVLVFATPEEFYEAARRYVYGESI